MSVSECVELTLDVRGYQYHIQTWGDKSKPMLFLLHGWMDCGASYQFLAPYLSDDYYLIAPDWRGFGQSSHTTETYWFQDYFADLEVILDYFAPKQQVDLVAHSMGGNVALLYAGVRSERVASVLSLEALGLASFIESDMRKSLQVWLDQVVNPEPTKIYPDWETLKKSIRKGNPDLNEESVETLSKIWATEVGDGQVQLRHDHKHRFINPLRYSNEDFIELWSYVTAKVGLVLADNSWQAKALIEEGMLETAQEVLGIDEQHIYEITDAGHMLHIQQPKKTAECIRAFYAD